MVELCYNISWKLTEKAKSPQIVSFIILFSTEVIPLSFSQAFVIQEGNIYTQIWEYIYKIIIFHFLICTALLFFI